MPVEKGVIDKGDGDDLTITEGRLRTCTAPGTVSALQGLIGIIHRDIPDSEDFFSASRCGIIGQTVHRGIPPLVC
jgi:hypothetical protein